MFHGWAAAAAMLCFAVAPVWASAMSDPASLTLEDAFRRTLERHPDLKRLPLAREVLRAESEQAAQRPPLAAGVLLENAFGSGAVSGLQGAELTLSLASVLERGDKREARIAVADRRIDALASDAEAKRLDLLAEVARRYLDVLATQELAAIAGAAIDQRRRTVDAATKRVAAGASPTSVKLAAEAALARAELDAARMRETATAARRRLAVLWGEREPAFARADGELLRLPMVAGFDELASLLERAPELQRFAGEERIREARLQLARSAAKPDVDWQVGLRRLQSGDDWAVVGSVSIPFGGKDRAAPGIRAAEAELAGVELEREAGAVSLYATLAEAYGRLQADALAVARADSDVLPKLGEAAAAAERAYRAGALSHLEWAQLQSEWLAARREQIEAARDYHRALIEIQRLTGASFVAASSAGTEKESP